MPLRDRTGPRGQGSRTGRGLGGCPPGTRRNSGQSAVGRGRGAGRRRGLNRDWGW